MRPSLFYGLIFCAACRNEPETTSPNLAVAFEQTVLREAPGEKSRELRPLKAGERLRGTGKVSTFVTPLRWGDTLLQAPWVQVQVAEQQLAWVFAAALRPMEGDAADWFLQQQMQCFFGSGLTNRRNRWREERAEGPPTEAGFARDYREALALRDTLMQRLAARAEPNEAGFQPDFYWLTDALPGFVFQMVAGGTQPYLFADYRDWQRKAAQTSGEQDDRFVTACLVAFEIDSIESPYPGWTLQTADQSGSSQLGTGRHLKMLRTIDAALAGGDLFRPELLAFKDRVLDDLLDQRHYWQAVEKIRSELDAIQAAGLRCLNERDRLALQERRKAFDDPAANGIQVNLRAGE